MSIYKPKAKSSSNSLTIKEREQIGISENMKINLTPLEVNEKQGLALAHEKAQRGLSSLVAKGQKGLTALNNKEQSLLPFPPFGRENTGFPSPFGRGHGEGVLHKETKSMENLRREREQQGERSLGARVISREKSDHIPQGNDLQSQNQMLNHPVLEERQDLDGYDPSVSPLPPANSEAHQKYEEAKKQQQEELQMRLGLTPGASKKYDTTPRPY
jgi:hypothetical protein